MIHLKKLIATFFSVLFFLSGLGYLLLSPLSGVLLILLAILIFPPFLSLLEKIGRKPKLSHRIFIGVALFMLSTSLAPSVPDTVDNSGNPNITPTVIAQIESEKVIHKDNSHSIDRNIIETSQENIVSPTPALEPTITPTVSEIKDEPNMKVHFIDVGQADCILIESSKQYMLIDAGNNADEELILSYLKKNKVDRLEYVIGTHPHEDHIGSLDAVIRNFDIGKVILPEKEHTTQTFEDVLDAIEEKGLKITKPVVGNEYTLGTAKFTIIAPNSSYGDDLNDWSVGIKLTNHYNSFILTGDAEKEAEEDILRNGIDLNADVLKLGHHGSKTSSTDEFLDAVKPNAVVISVGKDNSYGHPNKDTIDKLTKRGIDIYRTDEQGTIIAVSDGKSIKWSTHPSKTNAHGDVVATATPIIKPTETPVQYEVPKTTTYILNKNTKKFHYPTCRSVKQMKESNKIYFDGARDEVINKGYSACKNCNP